jgi:hypothetical protein
VVSVVTTIFLPDRTNRDISEEVVYVRRPGGPAEIKDRRRALRRRGFGAIYGKCDYFNY